MIEEARIARPKTQGALHHVFCVDEPPLLEVGPGHRVRCINVAADRRLALGQSDRLVEAPVVVREEKGEVTVVDDLVEQGQPAYVFDERVLPFRVLPATDYALFFLSTTACSRRPRRAYTSPSVPATSGSGITASDRSYREIASAYRPCAARTFPRPASA